MRKIPLSLLSVAILATFTAMFGMTACADTTAPHNDCTIVNGALICRPT